MQVLAAFIARRGHQIVNGGLNLVGGIEHSADTPWAGDEAGRG